MRGTHKFLNSPDSGLRRKDGEMNLSIFCEFIKIPFQEKGIDLFVTLG